MVTAKKRFAKPTKNVKESSVAKIPERVIEVPSHLKVFLFGDSEVGKSMFASGLGVGGSLPEFGTVADDVLFCDVDGGMASLVSHGIIIPHKYPREGRLTTLEQLKAIPETARKLGVSRVSIDTLTRLQFELMKDFMKNYRHKIQDWQYIKNVFSETCSELLDLGCHVICTAHVDEREDVNLPKEAQRDPIDPNNTIWAHPSRYQPSLQGAMRTLIKGFFDVVGFYRIDWDSKGNIVRKLELEPSKRWVARNRLNLPGTMKNPDFPTILNTWDGNKERLVKALKDSGQNFTIR